MAGPRYIGLCLSPIKRLVQMVRHEKKRLSTCLELVYFINFSSSL
jgi:hypothetical protein